MEENKIYSKIELLSLFFPLYTNDPCLVYNAYIHNKGKGVVVVFVVLAVAAVETDKWRRRKSRIIYSLPPKLVYASIIVSHIPRHSVVTLYTYDMMNIPRFSRSLEIRSKTGFFRFVF